MEDKIVYWKAVRSNLINI